jgi:hypothetical protein
MALDAGEAASVISVVLVGALERRSHLSEPPPAEQTAAVLARVVVGGLARPEPT